jgi:excisionase family DNA binding protein
MTPDTVTPDWTRGVPVAEAAAYVGVSVDTIRRWADQGLIESHRTPGGQRRIILESLNPEAKSAS